MSLLTYFSVSLRATSKQAQYLLWDSTVSSHTYSALCAIGVHLHIPIKVVYSRAFWNGTVELSQPPWTSCTRCFPSMLSILDAVSLDCGGVGWMLQTWVVETGLIWKNHKWSCELRCDTFGGRFVRVNGFAILWRLSLFWMKCVVWASNTGFSFFVGGDC